MDSDKILEIENKYNLYEDTIDGINYWVYARFEICMFYFSRLRDPSIGESHYKLKNKASFVKKVGGLIWNSIWNGKRKISKAEICIIDHERRVWGEQAYECKYTKQIYEHFKEKAIILERPYNYGHLKSIAKEKIVYLDYISLLCNLYYLYIKYCRKKKYHDIYNNVKEHMEAPLIEMNQQLHMKCKLEDVAVIITKIILTNKVRIKKMEELLDKIQPKILIETVGYSNTCMAANEVARRKRITIYEMQHGEIGPEHYAYNYRTNKNIIQFPDYILLFGDYWKLGIEYPLKKENIKSVGFPYLEEQVRKERGKRNVSKKKTVLFLSTGMIGRKLSKLACKFVLMMDANIECEVIYKLHPGEYLAWEQTYPELRELYHKGKIQVIDSNESNLYALFAKSDVQIGGTPSTAIFEGLAFNLLTIVYNMFDLRELNYLFENDLAYKIDDIEDAGIIYKIMMEKQSSKKNDWEFIWKSNAMKNIIEVIEQTSNIR